MIQKRMIWLLVIIILIGLSATLLTGCGGQQTTTEPPVEQQNPAQQEAPETPAEQQAPVEQATIQVENPVETTAIDGKTLLEERCTACHSLERTQGGQRDLAGWQQTIDRMISKGAKINQDEAKVLAEYLTNLK